MAQTKRFTHIDALRGVAVLLVLWQHAAEKLVNLDSIAAHGTLLADAASAVDFGRIGVICFFMISGFVVPSSFGSGPAPVRFFLIRRFFRLYPAYWLSLFACVALAMWLGNMPWSKATVLINATMLQQFFNVAHVQGLYWTLTLELVFYALCVMLFLRKKLSDMRFLSQLTACFCVFYAIGQLLSRFVPSMAFLDREFIHLAYVMGYMLLGAMLRLAHDKPSPQAVRSCRWAVGFLLLFPVMSLLVYYGFAGDEEFLRFGAAYPLALLLFFVGVFVIKLRSRALMWVGTVSYSAYLLHPLVIDIVYHYAAQYALGHLAVYLAIVAALTLLCAWLCFVFIEKPAIAFGRVFSSIK